MLSSSDGEQNDQIQNVRTETAMPDDLLDRASSPGSRSNLVSLRGIPSPEYPFSTMNSWQRMRAIDSLFRSRDADRIPPLLHQGVETPFLNEDNGMGGSGDPVDWPSLERQTQQGNGEEASAAFSSQSPTAPRQDYSSSRGAQPSPLYQSITTEQQRPTLSDIDFEEYIHSLPPELQFDMRETRRGRRNVRVAPGSHPPTPSMTTVTVRDFAITQDPQDDRGGIALTFSRSGMRTLRQLLVSTLSTCSE